MNAYGSHKWVIYDHYKIIIISINYLNRRKCTHEAALTNFKKNILVLILYLTLLRLVQHVDNFIYYYNFITLAILLLFIIHVHIPGAGFTYTWICKKVH